MHRAPRLTAALAALSLVAIGAVPCFGQATAPVQRVAVYYQPTAGHGCVDATAMDVGATGVSRLPGAACRNKAARAGEGLALARR